MKNKWRLIVRRNNIKVYTINFETLELLISRLIEISQINNLPSFFKNGKLITVNFMNTLYSKIYEFKIDIPNFTFVIKKISKGNIDQISFLETIEKMLKENNNVKKD